MGTTGGDRERLFKTVDDAKVYAVISPQMGKQVLETILLQLDGIVESHYPFLMKCSIELITVTNIFSLV